MKSYKDMINEVLTKSTPAGEWIKDFVDSDNPKFAGKSAAKRKQMALAAYYAKQNESAAASQNSTAEVDMREAVEYKGIGTDVVDKKKKLNPQPNLMSDKKQVKDFKEEVKKSTGDLKKACWKGYTAVGLKMKNGRKVPNCVPEEVQVEEGKVYDPITKKMVATKPIKVQAGGGATRNGVPVETGPSKYKERPSRPGDIYGKSFTEETELGESAGLPHALAQVGKDKWHIYDTKTQKVHSTYNNKNVAMKKYGELNDKHTGYETAGGIVKGKYGVRKEELEQIDEISKQTADSYLSKVTKDQVSKQGIQPNMYDKLPKNRQQGVSNALKRLIKKEDVQIDELSKTTLQSYRDKAAKDVGRAYAIHQDPSKKTDKDDMRKLSNRVKGDERAEIGLKKEDVQIDEVSKSTLVSYIDKASQDVHDKAMAAGSHHAGKSYKDFMANYAKSGKRQAGITKAAVKLAKEETIDEAIAKKLPVQHAVNAVHKTLGSKAATRFLGHLKPGTEKHTSWDKVNSALMKQGVQTKHIASIAQKTSHENVEESRGHKVLATFFKNREVAQRAFTGQNDKEKQPTYNEKDIETPKKEVKKESVNPALMAILKKRQEAQKKKEEDKKKVSEAYTPSVQAPSPKKTKSTAKEYTKAPIPGTKRITRAKPDSSEPGESLKEDQYTSDYKIKYYVDPITGENKTRKIRPHRVNFKASKMRGEPVQQDAQGDYGMKEGYVAEGGFDNYHEIAKELIKRHGKNVDTGHINDLAGERDTHRGLDHSEVMHHVNKLLGSKEVKEGDEYDEQWKEYKGKTFKKESRMINFKDYLKEAHLSAKQKKIAAIAGDKDKIDADDLAALRAGKKPVEEAKKCMDEDDMDESGLRMAAHAAHKSGKKEFEFQGKTYPVKVQKEEVEQIDELSKKTLGSYVNKAAKDSRIHGQIATDFENTADKARKQSKKDSFERLNRKYLEKAWKREDGIAKAVGKLTKEEVELDESAGDKLLQAAREYKQGSHEYHKGMIKYHDHMADVHHGKREGKEHEEKMRHHKSELAALKEEVELDEGRMKELAMDLKDMSHDEFHKQYGKPKSHYDSANFKKPVQPGKEMDRARALAQRGMKSLSKEEVERIEEKLSQLDELSKKTLGSYVKKASGDLASSIHYERDAEEDDDSDAAGAFADRAGKRLDGLNRAGKKIAKEEVELEEATTRKDFQMVADLIKGHESAEKRKELATHHAGIFAKQNPRFDHAKFMKAAGVNEEVEQETSPYLKATLSIMDEGKIDDLRDAQKLRAATKSAYDKNFKPDTSHPHIQVVKGTAYGGANQKDDEGDEKPDDEAKEKRGRGRPSGSKSGARLKGGGHEDGGIPVHNLNLPKSYK